MSSLIRRLREPPFGTETSERNLMASAADTIQKLEQALEKIAALEVGRFASADELVADARSIATRALANVRGSQVTA